MDVILKNMKKHFPVLPEEALTKIYKERAERQRLLMNNGIPEDVRRLIEAKVRTTDEFSKSFNKYLPGNRRSSFSKRRRAKHFDSKCIKCARWTCNAHCRSLGLVSRNREDKIQFIKDGLRKESFDDILETLEAHPCGSVQLAILSLWRQYEKEHNRYSPGNLTLKDPVCQFIRKLDGKRILDS